MVILLVFLLGFAFLGAIAKPTGSTIFIVALLCVSLPTTLLLTGRV